MTNKEKIRTVARQLLSLADEIEDEHGQLAYQIRDAAYDIRGSVLHGSVPDESVMRSLDALLKKLDIPYAVVGAVAVGVHGFERATTNVDFLVKKRLESDLLRDKDFMSTFGFYHGNPRLGGLPYLHHREGRCEMIPAVDAMRTWALSTAKPELVLGIRAPVVSVEALVCLKIAAILDNPSRAAKDLSDVFGLSMLHKFDVDDIRAHVSQEGLDLLRAKMAIPGL